MSRRGLSWCAAMLFGSGLTLSAWCGELPEDLGRGGVWATESTPSAIDDGAVGVLERSIDAQREDSDSTRGWRGRIRGWWRRDSPYLKNHASIKTAYRAVLADATKSTVEVLGDGNVVALGTVVDPRGYVVTKASLLAGKLSCRIAGREALEATLVGVSVDHDLALLTVAAQDLVAVSWRAEPAPPGTLVAAAAPDGDPIGIGVISAEPREVPAPEGVRRGGWLGISLGGEKGTEIANLADASAATLAGLEVGDAIQSIDGAPMQSTDQIVAKVRSHAPGDTLSIVVQRQASQLTKTAVLLKMPEGTLPEDQWGGGPFSVRREGFPRVLPHDTAISPGQCGGPLIDTDGKAVGINIARALRVTTYAIPADIVQQFVTPLIPHAG